MFSLFKKKSPSAKGASAVSAAHQLYKITHPKADMSDYLLYFYELFRFLAKNPLALENYFAKLPVKYQSFLLCSVLGYFDFAENRDAALPSAYDCLKKYALAARYGKCAFLDYKKIIAAASDKKTSDYFLLSYLADPEKSKKEMQKIISAKPALPFKKIEEELSAHLQVAKLRARSPEAVAELEKTFKAELNSYYSEEIYFLLHQIFAGYRLSPTIRPQNKKALADCFLPYLFGEPTAIEKLDKNENIVLISEKERPETTGKHLRLRYTDFLSGIHQLPPQKLNEATIELLGHFLTVFPEEEISLAILKQAYFSTNSAWIKQLDGFLQITTNSKLAYIALLCLQNKEDNFAPEGISSAGKLPLFLYRLPPLEPPKANLRLLSGDPSGNFLIGADINGLLYLWELATGKILLLHQADIYLTYLAFCPRGNFLAVRSATGYLTIFKIPSFKTVQDFTLDEKLSCLAFSNDGQLIATGDSEGFANIYEIGTAKKLKTLKVFNKAILFINFTPDHKYLLVSQENEETVIISIEHGTEQALYPSLAEAKLRFFAPLNYLVKQDSLSHLRPFAHSLHGNYQASSEDGNLIIKTIQTLFVQKECFPEALAFAGNNLLYVAHNSNLYPYEIWDTPQLAYELLSEQLTTMLVKDKPSLLTFLSSVNDEASQTRLID